MNQFGRALKLSLNHRLNVAGCILSSLIVAVLWGGNLTAVYPLVNVIMNDHSLPEWIDEKIAESDKEVADNTRWLDVLKGLPADQTDDLKAAIEKEIADRQTELADHFNPSAGKLDHIEIAEKTRLTNVVAELESIRQAPPDKIAAKLAYDKSEAERQIKAYHSLAVRYHWISPMAHRWLPTTPLATLVLICFLVLVGTLLKSAARIWNTYLVARLGNMVGYDLRIDFYRQMLRLDMSNFTEAGRGDLMNRCTSDLNSVTQGVQRVFGQAMLEPLQMLVCLGLAAWVSWQLLLLTMIVAPPAGYAIFWLGKSLKRTHRKAMQEFSFIYETLTETLSGIKLIQAFTMEPTERNKFHKSAKEYYRRQMKIATYNSLVNPVTEVLGIVMVLIAALMGGYLVLGQHTHIFGIKISDLALDHGQMSMFFAMLAGLADPARRLSQEFNQLQQGVAAADRVYEIIDREPKIVDPIHPLPLPALTRSLVFENIDFSYQPEKQVLGGVSLAIQAGETIAIVGPNGCGKSTLLQLVLRFYDPQQGRITIDGTDIRDVKPPRLADSLRRRHAGDPALQRYRGQQHRLRRTRCHTCRHRSRRPEGLRPHLHHRETPRGLRFTRRPRRQPPFRRPAATDRARPRHPSRPRSADPRRSHESDRRRKRAADPQRAARFLPRPHDAARHTSHEHDFARRPRRRHGPRPNRRRRHRRRTLQPLRALPSPLPQRLSRKRRLTAFAALTCSSCLPG